jgi:hypothetical protein
VTFDTTVVHAKICFEKTAFKKPHNKPQTSRPPQPQKRLSNQNDQIERYFLPVRITSHFAAL